MERELEAIGVAMGEFGEVTMGRATLDEKSLDILPENSTIVWKLHIAKMRLQIKILTILGIFICEECQEQQAFGGWPDGFGRIQHSADVLAYNTTSDFVNANVNTYNFTLHTKHLGLKVSKTNKVFRIVTKVINTARRTKIWFQQEIFLMMIFSRL